MPECPVGLHPEAGGSGCPAVCVSCVPPAAAEMGLSASLPVPHSVCWWESCLGIALSLFKTTESLCLHTPYVDKLQKFPPVWVKK